MTCDRCDDRVGVPRGRSREVLCDVCFVTCEVCGKPGEPRGWSKDDGPVLCDGCCATEAEAAAQRAFEAYHGGSGPQTLAEQYQAAAQVKREQR